MSRSKQRIGGCLEDEISQKRKAKKVGKKSMSGMTWIIILAIIFILIAATQKVIINDRQISVANNKICSFLSRSYDSTTKLCVTKNETNAQEQVG